MDTRTSYFRGIKILPLVFIEKTENIQDKTLFVRKKNYVLFGF